MLSNHSAGQPTQSKSFLFQAVFLVLLLATVLVVLIQVMPSYNPLAGRDSGVFLYIGKQVLQGQVPYRDVWDHKPPMVFYIDALGLFLGNGNRWGSFAVEALSLFTAFVLAFYFLRSLFGDHVAALATFSGVLFSFWSPGNLSEEYYLPYAFLAFLIWLIIQKQGKNASWWIVFLWGLTGGIAFQLKQTLVGIWLAFAVFYGLKMLVEKDGRYIKILLWMALGAITPELIFIVYFAANHALEQYWSAAFIFNFIYSNNVHSTFSANILSTLQRITTTGAVILPLGFFFWLLLWPRLFQTLGRTLAGHFDQRWPGWILAGAGILGLLSVAFLISKSPQLETLFTLNKILIFIFSLVGILIGVLWLQGTLASWFSKDDSHISLMGNQPLNELWIILFLDWAIETVLISVSGRSYGHYLEAILPVSVILLAEFLNYLRNSMRGSAQGWFFWPLACALCLPIYYTGVSQIITTLTTQPDNRSSLATYLEQNTTQQDTVLVWGDNVDYVFLAGRNSPEKFIYQYPLYYSQYVTDEMVEGFLNNLKSAPPKFVVDAGDPQAPFISFNEQGVCIHPTAASIDNHPTPVPQQLSALFQFFCDHYTLADHSSMEWPIYRYMPSQ